MLYSCSISCVFFQETVADHVSKTGEFYTYFIYVYDYLEVYVERAKGLSSSDAYITTCILTTNNKFFQMRKSHSMKKSFNPMFLESFKVCWDLT